MLLSKTLRNSLTISLFLACLAVVGCGGRGQAPKTVYEQILRDAEANQFEMVWDQLSLDSQEQLDKGLQGLVIFATALAQGDPRIARLRDLRGRELFVYAARNDMAIRDKFRQRQVVKEEIRGDRAILRVKETSDQKAEIIDTVYMVRERGEWKLSLVDGKL